MNNLERKQPSSSFPHTQILERIAATFETLELELLQHDLHHLQHRARAIRNRRCRKEADQSTETAEKGQAMKKVKKMARSASLQAPCSSLKIRACTRETSCALLLSTCLHCGILLTASPFPLLDLAPFRTKFPAQILTATCISVLGTLTW